MRTVIIVFFLACAALAQNHEVLAVIDLENKGGATRRDVDVICDAIAEKARSDGRYYIFDRSLIGEVLGETGIPRTSSCSHEQCLSTFGNLLGAQKVIGGSIIREGKKATIQLILVDVQSRIVENTITIKKRTSRRDLTDIHLPLAVTKLLTGKSNGRRTEITRKEKNRWWLPITGMLVMGAAVAGGYLYLELESENSTSISDEIPLDDVPIRTR